MKIKLIIPLICVIFAVNATAHAAIPSGGAYIELPPLTRLGAPSDPVAEVRSLLQNSYVEPVRPEVLERNTIAGMLAELGDPHTTHMSLEAYEDFLDSLNMNFTGVGIYIEIVPEGVLVTGLVPGGPADRAGLLPGDVIITVDGQAMAGLASEEAAGMIRGPESTVVVLGVLRDGIILTIPVTREEITIPLVTGEMMGAAGYLDLSSFGENVGALFGEEARRLEGQGADRWIVDLRNNGGGYLSGALDVLGYFIPGEIALVAENRYTCANSKATVQETPFNGPLIVFINRYSASASEIVAAALKDYHRVLLLGETSYGKGTMQTLFRLSDGSVLKMTTWRYYSPAGKPVDHVGVTPHLALADEYLAGAARLLLGPEDEGHVLTIDGTGYYVDLSLARQPDYWPVYAVVLQALNEAPYWEHYYPGYHLINQLEDVLPDKEYTVKFNLPVVPDTINSDTVQLIKSDTGERIAAGFAFEDEKTVKVRPDAALEAGKEYWLLISEGITSKSGSSLKKPVVATITVE